jgi:hypothetical protein
VQIVLGSPWYDAVIRHLEPRSPYRPWQHNDDVRENDSVMVVFDTEPALVLTELGRVEADLSIDNAITGLSHDWTFNNAVPATQLAVELPAAPTVVDGSLADALISAATQQQFGAQPEDRFGTSSSAAARALLESRGRCTACGKALPLTNRRARDSIAAWTVEESSTDWPAALCVSCVTNMGAGHFESFVDFKYFLHPTCPKCGQRRSRQISFGMPVFPFNPPPWIDHRGCCMPLEKWACARCGHAW